MKKTKSIKKKSICVKLKTKCIKKKNKKKCVKKTICAKRKMKCVKRHKKTHKRYSGLPIKTNLMSKALGLSNKPDKNNTTMSQGGAASEPNNVEMEDMTQIYKRRSERFNLYDEHLDGISTQIDQLNTTIPEQSLVLNDRNYKHWDNVYTQSDKKYAKINRDLNDVISNSYYFSNSNIQKANECLRNLALIKVKLVSFKECLYEWLYQSSPPSRSDELTHVTQGSIWDTPMSSYWHMLKTQQSAEPR